MDYQQLRAAYDAAFDRMRRADSELRSIRQQPAPDAADEETARKVLDRAVADYRAARKNLAGFLLSRQPKRRPVVQVRALAHRLWEEAGRPLGHAEEHWYRAEEMLRCGQ